MPIEPRIIELPRLFIVGAPYYGRNDAGQIPHMWDVYGKLSDQVTNGVKPWVCYGVETYPTKVTETSNWFYMAGVEVTDLNEVPVQLAAKIIPANRYACFTHRGPLQPALGQLFEYIYHEWLPTSEYEQAGPYDLERYTATFKGPTDPDSELDVLIPIK